jgi:hypothetical protein
MDYKEAFQILNINLNETDYKDVTLDFLKKKYHKQALIHHPDKNGNTIESKEKFQKINDAYDYLKREICCNNSENDNSDSSAFSWTSILQMFMMGILEGKYNDLFLKIVNDIVCGYKTISVKLFEGLSKDTCLDLYMFLSKYRSTFKLNDEILEKVRDIVLQKYDNVEIYKLNPCIHDLLNNNIYKLYVNNELYLEVFPDNNTSNFNKAISELTRISKECHTKLDWKIINNIFKKHKGIPIKISE